MVMVVVVMVAVVMMLITFLPFLVNSNVFFAARTAFTIVFVDLDLFLFVGCAVFTTWN